MDLQRLTIVSSPKSSLRCRAHPENGRAVCIHDNAPEPSMGFEGLPSYCPKEASWLLGHVSENVSMNVI